MRATIYIAVTAVALALAAPSASARLTITAAQRATQAYTMADADAVVADGGTIIEAEARDCKRLASAPRAFRCISWITADGGGDFKSFDADGNELMLRWTMGLPVRVTGKSCRAVSVALPTVTYLPDTQTYNVCDRRTRWLPPAE